MTKVSIRVPEDMKRRMEAHREVNWSEVARQAFDEQLDRVELADAIASKSDLTEGDSEEVGDMVKEAIAERHGLSG